MSPEEIKTGKEMKFTERLGHAARGVKVFVAHTHHIVIHATCAFTALLLGYFFNISSLEWIAVIFCIGFVIVAEAFNTAIEIDIDLTSPEYHPYARDTKDVAAASVLLASLTALIIGGIIFLPKVIPLFTR